MIRSIFKSLKDRRLIIWMSSGAVAAAGLYVISRDNFLLFHVLTEMLSILIAWATFIIFWNTRQIEENAYFLMIGIAFLFVGFLDLLHTLAYEGMNIIPGYGTNNAAQIWIAARSIQAISLFAAPFFMTRRIRERLVFLIFFAVTALLLGSIFSWGIFPACFVVGKGLTPFKITAEYIISAFLIASIVLLIQRRSRFNGNVFFFLNLSLITAVASEILLTLYRYPYGFSNMLGHLTKIASFYFMYRAVVKTTLIDPYAVLFRNIKRSQETQQALLNVTKNRAILLSIDGTIIALNDSAAADFDKEASDLIGADIYALLTPRLARSMREKSAAAVKTRQPMSFEEELDGRYFAIGIYPVLDSEGAVIQWAIYNEEITERKKMERELIELSITDNLTGLFNQRHFTKRIKEEVDRARRTRYPLCLVIFDVDNFKEYNDRHGHLKGDQILRTVGEITLRSIRNEVDSGFRYGGDEFALILPYADPVMAENITKRIYLKVIEKTKGVTISYGISALKDGTSIDELITSADEKMYRNKNAAKQNKITGS